MYTVYCIYIYIYIIRHFFPLDVNNSISKSLHQITSTYCALCFNILLPHSALFRITKMKLFAHDGKGIGINNRLRWLKVPQFGQVEAQKVTDPNWKISRKDYIYIYIMTSICEGQPPKTRPFRIKTRVIWVPGMYIYIYIFISIYI